MHPIDNIVTSNNFEHCHVYTTRFFSSKVKFIYTSTVTRSHSCYGKKYAYVSRTFCYNCFEQLKTMIFHHYKTKSYIFSSDVDSRASSQRIPCCSEGSVEPVEKFSHCRSDVELPHCSNNNKQLSTQDDVIVDVHENTSSLDDSSILCNDQFYERPPSNKSFSCTQCEISFMSIEELTSHCVVHKEATIHQYRNCDKTMTAKDYTMAYNGEHPFQLHGSADGVPHKDLSQTSAKSFSCTRCDIRFMSIEALTSHCSSSPHKEKTLKLQLRAQFFPCNVCNKKFATKSTLKQHARIHTGECPFQCNVCNKKFAFRSTLNQHARIHTGECPFQCSVCNKKFTFKSTLKKHALIHTGDCPFQCGVCNKKFAFKSTLKQHARIHTGERPFQCSVCNKKFAFISNLKQHFTLHTGEPPFQCNVCYKKFAFKSTLKPHARIHTGERPFRCSVCNKRFPYKSSLRKHARIHTGQRLFQCNICGKFVRHLERHLFTHTNERPFPCNVCNKTFKRNYNLTVHKQIHTGERPFQCNICKRCFPAKTALRFHLLTHTDKNPYQ